MNAHTTPILDYSGIAKMFHWATALLFFLQFPAGYAITLGVQEHLLMDFHMAVGLIIFWVVVFRAAYRLRTFRQRRDSRLAPWQKTASTLVHTGLYVLLLCVPLMGWLATYSWEGGAAKAWIPLPPSLIPGKQMESLILFWHGTMAFTLLSAIFVHIAIAMQGYLEGDHPGDLPEQEGMNTPATAELAG